MEAVLNVPEKELIKINEGQLAIVSIDALNDRDFEGVVERIAPEVDASSGTFRVTVALNNPDNLLKPGMFVRVNVRFDSSENTLLVNREAVVTQRDENTVFVVRDGLAMRQSVELGYAMGGDVEILNGLDEGDEVIVYRSKWFERRYLGPRCFDLGEALYEPCVRLHCPPGYRNDGYDCRCAVRRYFPGPSWA